MVTAWAVGWRGRLLAAPIVIELGYAVYLQVCFVTSHRADRDGPQGRMELRARATAGNGVLLVPYGILLPTSILATDWYQALCLWVGFNTLVFAFLSLMQLLPPLQLGSRWHRLSQR